MTSEHPNQVTTSRLACPEINSQSGNPAILFIHGAFASGAEWDLVTPHLADDYHILLPDLPGHGGSREVGYFSKGFAAELLANLICERTLDVSKSNGQMGNSNHVVATWSLYFDRVDLLFHRCCCLRHLLSPLPITFRVEHT
jgi:pimeloyl-ACP methyl ester carboxylesterase